MNELETQQNNDDLEIIPILASIQDKKKITILLNTWKPDTIYHAAAYKHVPIVEQNLAEGLKNNVFGTLVIAEASIKVKYPI